MTLPLTTPNRRILVVDDNREIHLDFAKILSPVSTDADALRDAEAALFGESETIQAAEKFEIESAFQGQEAFEMVGQAYRAGNPYAMAFVDICMPPGWDGVETISRIWNEHPELQVVVCTAYAEYSWNDLLRRLDRKENLLILKKPFENIEVRQLARALTEKWHLARQAAMKLQEVEKIVEQRTVELQEVNGRLRKEIGMREQAEDQLRHDSLHDTLTGLPNRALLMDRLNQSVRRSVRDADYRFAVLFLDIDNFKVVNDSLGHAVGDQLLIGVASRLTETVRASDSVVRIGEGFASRLGGDEFVILLDDISNTVDASRVAERIHSVLAVLFQLGDHELVISTSIGIAVSCRSETSAEALLRDADTAMYRAKSNGKARHAVFDEAMHAAAVNRLSLENDLRRAVEAAEFIVHYQPIVCIETSRTAGFEALARWNHPTRGILLPDIFIPIAEETGLIAPLGRQVLEAACEMSRKINQHRPQGQRLRVSVNISKRQLTAAGFLKDVCAVLESTRCPAEGISFEITESVIPDDPSLILDKLTAIRALGIELHMDDFGKGLSSIALLRDLPFNKLKIDQSFVRCLESHKKYAAIIHSVVELAHNMDMKTIAEGIETADQFAQLLTLGCDFGQGFLFSKPVTAEMAESLMKEFTIQPPLVLA